MLTGALRSLFAVVENYPTLKANENVLSLQEQLTTTENQISFARQHYNATVLDYNTAIQTFPGLPLAGMFGFTKREFFDAEPEAQAVPRVQLRSAPGPPGAILESSWPPTFYSEIAANRRNSCSAGRDPRAGSGRPWQRDRLRPDGDRRRAMIGAIVIAVVIGSMTSLASYFYGDQLVLAASSAKPVSEEQHPSSSTWSAS